MTEFTTSYSYDEHDRMTSQTYPSGMIMMIKERNGITCKDGILMKKYLWISLCFIILSGCSKNKVQRNEEKIIVKINYMMFAVDTYVPVTTATIGTVTSKNISLTKKEIETVYKVFKKTIPIPKFDDQMVRLRIAIPNKKVIFVESSGVVLDGKEVKKIDILGLKTLENILDVNLGSEIGLYPRTLGSDDKPKIKY